MTRKSAWSWEDFWNSKMIRYLQINNKLKTLPKRFLAFAFPMQVQFNSLWKEKVESQTHLHFLSFFALYKVLQSFSPHFEDGMVKESSDAFLSIWKRCDEQISVHISRHTAISIPSDNADISFLITIQMMPNYHDPFTELLSEAKPLHAQGLSILLPKKLSLSNNRFSWSHLTGKWRAVIAERTCSWRS